MDEDPPQPAEESPLQVDDVQPTAEEADVIVNDDDIQPTAEEANVIVNDEESTEKSEKISRLPLARIRSLIKADSDVAIASQESVFLITKATELFIEQLTKDVYRVTQGNKRKTIQRKDLDVIIETNEELAFLEGTLDLK